MTDRHPRHPDHTAKYVVGTIVVAMIVIWAQNQIGSKPVDNSPYTGLCNQPTGQLSC